MRAIACKDRERFLRFEEGGGKLNGNNQSADAEQSEVAATGHAAAAAGRHADLPLDHGRSATAEPPDAGLAEGQSRRSLTPCGVGLRPAFFRPPPEGRPEAH